MTKETIERAIAAEIEAYDEDRPRCAVCGPIGSPEEWDRAVEATYGK